MINVNELINMVMYLDSVIDNCAWWEADSWASETYLKYRMCVWLRDAYLRHLAVIAEGGNPRLARANC